MPMLEVVRSVADPAGGGSLEAFVWKPFSFRREWAAGIRRRPEGAFVAGDAFEIVDRLETRSAAVKFALRLLRARVASAACSVSLQATLSDEEGS